MAHNPITKTLPPTLQLIKHELEKLNHTPSKTQGARTTLTYQHPTNKKHHTPRHNTTLWLHHHILHHTITTITHDKQNNKRTDHTTDKQTDIRNPNYNPQHTIQEIHQWLTNPPTHHPTPSSPNT